MDRRALNLLAVVSLLLFLLITVISVRSRWRISIVSWGGTNWNGAAVFDTGVMSIRFGPNYRGADAFPTTPGWDLWSGKSGGNGLWNEIRIADYRRFGRWGFAFSQPGFGESTLGAEYSYFTGYSLYSPYWIFLGLFFFLPAAVGLRTWRRHHRLGRGLCLACGYDLQATPDRCPECGTIHARGNSI